MPQLLALEECLGTISGEGGFTIEGIGFVASAFLEVVPSEKRPRFFLATGAKLATVGRDGPAVAQKDSDMLSKNKGKGDWNARCRIL